MTFPRNLAAALCVLALAGCGGGDSDADDQADIASPAPTTVQEANATPVAVEYEPVSEAAVGRVKPTMSVARVREILKVEPVQIQARPEYANGCLYYLIANAPPGSAWTFCFDERGLNSSVTAYTLIEFTPPQDASPMRVTLIGRGDSDCQGEYGKLKDITREVAQTLAAHDRQPNQVNTEAVGTALARFNRNLERTHTLLAAYEAPVDAAESLTGYLDSLQSQIDALDEARDAFLDGDIATYEALGDEFNELAATAKGQAREYGFAVCSASKFA